MPHNGGMFMFEVTVQVIDDQSLVCIKEIDIVDKESGKVYRAFGNTDEEAFANAYALWIEDEN